MEVVAGVVIFSCIMAFLIMLSGLGETNELISYMMTFIIFCFVISSIILALTVLGLDVNIDWNR